MFQAESFRLFGVSELGGCQVVGFEVWFGLPGLIGVQEDGRPRDARKNFLDSHWGELETFWPY